MTATAIINMKLPSLNEYIDVCRENKYKAAQFKRDTETAISWFLGSLPEFKRPVDITFYWIEENNRRDCDNVAFAKKFILDALVKTGKLQNDNRKHVVGFTDVFGNGQKAKVIINIREV